LSLLLLVAALLGWLAGLALAVAPHSTEEGCLPLCVVAFFSLRERF